MRIKTLSASVCAAMCVIPILAADFGSIRRLATEQGTPITRKTRITGTVICRRDSPNREYNPNIGDDTVDTLPNAVTSYIQSRDGRHGLRLQFDSPEALTLTFGERATLDLRGCTVTRENDPERYTVSGLTSENIVSARSGGRIAEKRKSIGELTDEDIYTLVTVRDAEFVFGNGRYANADESCLRRADSMRGMADGLQRLLRNGDNEQLAMLVNAGCGWRHGAVPRGAGDIRGIIVHTRMRRYGDSTARYAIRPNDVSDIDIAPTAASQFKTLVEWNWDDNPRAELKFEYHGTRKARYGSIIGDRILPDKGYGFLSTDSGAYLSAGDDYDAQPDSSTAADKHGKHRAAAKNGIRKYGALRLDSDSRDWFRFDAERRYAGGNALIAETSTDGIDGTVLTLDFTFGAGDGRAKRALRYPVRWRVEYSTDGETFTPVDSEPVIMRPVPYKPGKDEYMGDMPLYYDTCTGLTEHSVTLPPSLFGRKRIFIRITPADNRVSWAPADASSPLAEREADFMFTCYRASLRFGTVAIKYR